MLGMLALLLGAAYLWRNRYRIVWIGRAYKLRILAVLATGLGCALLFATIGVMKASATNSIRVAVICSIGYAIQLAWQRRNAWARIPKAFLPKRSARNASSGAAESTESVAAGVDLKATVESEDKEPDSTGSST